MGKVNFGNPMVKQILGILAIVIAITMMGAVLDQFDAIRAINNFATLPILPSIITLFPAILYLGLITIGEVLFVQGGMSLSKDNPIMGIVTAIIGIIVFLAMFVTIVSSSLDLAARNGIANYTLMPTLVGLVPTVLFIIGILSSGWLAYKSMKASGKTGKAKAATA